MSDSDELTGDRKKILEKLMEQDEDEPEVGETINAIMIDLFSEKWYAYYSPLGYFQKC